MRITKAKELARLFAGSPRMCAGSWRTQVSSAIPGAYVRELTIDELDALAGGDKYVPQQNSQCHTAPHGICPNTEMLELAAAFGLLNPQPR